MKQHFFVPLLFTILAIANACGPELKGPLPKIQARAEPPRVKTLIKNVNVFDGQQMLPQQQVIINADGTIGSSNDTTDIATSIDAQNGYLIPGLIDSHSHALTPENLQELVGWGVTSTMLMACPFNKYCQMLQNQPGLTSVVSSGIPAVGPGSAHSRLTGTAPDLWIYNTSMAASYAQMVFNNGSDFMKIVSEEPNGPSLEEQIALVAGTHGLGKQSMTHASQYQPFVTAVRSKSNGIQHTPADGNFTTELLSLMKEQSQWHVPTLTVIKAFQNNPLSLKNSSYNLTSFPIAIENVKRVYAAGVPIIVGTDATGHLPSLNITCPFGSTVHDEMSFLVNEVGMEPAEAIRAATILPAALQAGMQGRGEIKTGLRADLLLLGSNPLVDIANTRDIKMIWVEGYSVRVNTTNTSNSTNSTNGSTPTSISNSSTTSTTIPTNGESVLAVWPVHIATIFGLLFFLIAL